MKKKIKLFNFDKKNIEDKSIYFKGHFFLNEKSYSGLDAINKINGIYPNFPETGKYSVLIKSKKNIVIYSDKVCSHNIYYLCDKEKNNIIISDCISFIIKNIKKYTLVKKNLDEIKLAGFVTNGETLIQGVRCTQPGEIININTESFKINIKKYFSYISRGFKLNDQSILIDEHQYLINKSFSRLKKLSKNKSLVVPLSAGLDSRLIVRELKRNNFENVICFSYGKKNNKESIKSKEIASRLGYKWVFVEYTNEKWNNILNSNPFKKYFFDEANFHLIPHIQDFIAVEFLKTNNLIKHNSIFIPGHTGDFISGGHIPPVFLGNVDYNKLKDLIIKKHYRVNNFQCLEKESQNYISQKIDNSIKNFYDLGYQSENIYEMFNWKERQHKHILQSLKIYEFFGFEWYIPLWDDGLIDFWRKIPLDLKINKTLYKNYLVKTDFDKLFLNVTSNANNNLSKPIKSKIISEILVFKRKIFRHFFEIKKYILDYFLHPLNWYKMFSYLSVLKVYKFQNIYSFLVRYYINEIKKSSI